MQIKRIQFTGGVRMMEQYRNGYQTRSIHEWHQNQNKWFESILQKQLK